MEDFYAILGVYPTSDQAAIDKAYKQQALRLHPDKNQGRDTTADFQKLGNVYDELKDLQKRRAYDKLHRARFPESYAQEIFASNSLRKSPSQSASQPLPRPPRPMVDIRPWKRSMHQSLQLRQFTWSKQLSIVQYNVRHWQSRWDESKRLLEGYQRKINKEVNDEARRLCSLYEKAGADKIHAQATANVRKNHSSNEEQNLEEDFRRFSASLRDSVNELRLEVFRYEQTEFQSLKEAINTSRQHIAHQEMIELDYITNFDGTFSQDIIETSRTWNTMGTAKPPVLTPPDVFPTFLLNRCLIWEHNPQPNAGLSERSRSERYLCGRCMEHAEGPQLCTICKTVLCSECANTVELLVKYYEWLIDSESKRFFVL